MICWASIRHAVLTPELLCRFRNELPDPSAQPKLMALKKDKDRYATFLNYLDMLILFMCVYESVITTFGRLLLKLQQLHYFVL